MLIKIPPGMTPEQYFQTPEGRATAERRRPDPQNLTIADDRPPRPTKYTYSPPGDRRRSPITRPTQPPEPKPLPAGYEPPERDPGFHGNLPIVPLPTYTGAGARQPAMRKPPVPGQAQPKADPYEAATPTPMDTFQEIFEALEEMAPDMPSGQRRAVARSLAEEYRRERMEAMDSLAPVPMAEPTEQMEFDQAYSEMQDVGRAEDRMKARMEAQLREERVAEMKKNQLEQRRANAQQGRAGVVGGRPQWQMDGQRPDARGNAPGSGGDVGGPRPGMPGVGPQRGRNPHPDFVSLHGDGKRFGMGIVHFYNPETGEEVTMPDSGYEPRAGTPWRRGRMPSPGMAQPIPPPSQGDPLGAADPEPVAKRGRSKEEMYWELVDGGMSPAEASKMVRDAFAYMPKQALVGRKKPPPPENIFAAANMQRAIYDQAAKYGGAPRELPANFARPPAERGVLQQEQELYRQRT